MKVVEVVVVLLVVVVVVMGLFSFVTLSGPLAPLRVAVFDQSIAFAPQGITTTVENILGVAPLITAMIIAAGFLIWALAYNSMAIPLAAFGFAPPWAAALGMSISSLIVMLNATRILNTPIHFSNTGQ